MLLRSILIWFIFFYSLQLFGQNNPDYTVYFEVDQFTLSKSEANRLNEYIASNSHYKNSNTLILKGHTDSDASDQYNEKLSQRRVESVAKLLTDLAFQVEPNKQWYGEKVPLNANITAEEKSKNRRVDIWFNWIPDRVEEDGDIRDLYKLLEQEKQRICISPEGDTVIRFDQGTIVYVPPYAFGDRIEKCIELRLKEFYKKSDMILENLSTTSNGQLLESEGMIYIEADANGEAIGLAPNKALTVLMPTDSLRSDIGIFNGQRDAHTNIMNWIASNGSQVSGLDPRAALDCYDPPLNDAQPDCGERCKFFMCRVNRIGKGFKGIVNKAQHDENKQLRKCQRILRKRGSSGGIGNPGTGLNREIRMDCAELDSLFALYGVDNREDLVIAMNKELMDKYGVNTLEELRDTLNREKMNNIEQNLAQGIVNSNDLKYYMFNTTRLGWINLDAFSKLQGKRITMNTDLEAKPHQDCKAVFKNVRGILPGQAIGSTFLFTNVPENNPIWLIGLRFTSNKAYLSLQNTITKEVAEDFQFVEMSIPEIREKLKIIDQ